MFIRYPVTTPTYEQMCKFFQAHNITLNGNSTDRTWCMEDDSYIISDDCLNYNKQDFRYQDDYDPQSSYEQIIIHVFTKILCITKGEEEYSEDSSLFNPELFYRAILSLYTETINYPHQDTLPAFNTHYQAINETELANIRRQNKDKTW